MIIPEQVRHRQPHRVTVASIAAGGDGVARVEGMAVFIPRTAPGDIADVSVTPKARFGRGELATLVRASPHRIEPRCRHYVADKCGGCQLQHMDYPSQLAAKGRIVSDAMERIARRGVDVPPVIPSPLEWEYRNKLTLTMRRTGSGWLAGLHSYDDPGRVFDLTECPITQPAVVNAWHEVRAAARWLPNERELRGAVRLLGDDLAFVLEGGTDWPHVARFVRSSPSLATVRWHSSSGQIRTMHDRRASAGPAASFEQVNPPVADVLRTSLVEHLGTARHVVDAYAGNGTTASILARRGANVTAIEVDLEAASFAAQRLPAGSRVITGRVEDVLELALPADAVLLNPSRTGVDRKVTALLERGPRPATVMYVSCNPATLARDLARMPGYRIAFLQPYDMFPQTAHVETLCQLVPEAA